MTTSDTKDRTFMRPTLLPSLAALLLTALALPATAAAQSLTFSCRQTAEFVVTVGDDGRVEHVQPKMSQPEPIRIVVQPNFDRPGDTKGPAGILDDRGRIKERFEGTISLEESVDGNKGAWHLDLKKNILRVVVPEAGRKARFEIYRCAPGNSPPAAAREFVYRCEDGQRVVAIFRNGTPDSVEVRFGTNERRVLPLKRSGSGARYSGDGYTFWNKGNEAIWTTPQRETTCRTNR